MGPEVEELEAVLANYVGCRHAITVASGTDSLEIALRALEIGPGDEVLTVPFTWISTAEVVLQVGATPTLNIQLALGDLAETVTVEGAAPLVDVRSAGISEVVDNQKIVELPLQGRQVTNLIILAGAAVNTTSRRERPGRPA